MATEPQTVTTAPLLDQLVEWLESRYKDRIAEMASGYPKDTRRVIIEWHRLNSQFPALAQDLLNHPREEVESGLTASELLDSALHDVPLPIDVDLSGPGDRPPATVTVELSDSKRLDVGDLYSEHRGTYLAVYGQLERVAQQTERMTHAVYRCQDCGTAAPSIPAPRDSFPDFSGHCPSNMCDSQSMRFDDDASYMVDMRKLQLKQPPERAAQRGRTLTAYVEGDLVSLSKRWDSDLDWDDLAGERVTLQGVLSRDLSPVRQHNARPEFDAYLEADHAEFDGGVLDDVDVGDHRDTIDDIIGRADTLDYAAERFAPRVAGGQRMGDIKRALVLYLCGGVRRTNQGEGERGDIHVLLAGDPGTAKTTLLDFVEAISPRSERMSGTEATGTGLTATAQQDEFAGGDWVLKPGLLPRASGGHALLDELDKFDGGSNLHEAMESQRIHVAKADISAELKTECGILAAANPVEGRFSGEFTDLVAELDLDPALYSRFDIVHTLHDTPDEDIDAAVAEAVLANPGELDRIDTDTWRAWIALAKDYNPGLTDDAVAHIKQWYREYRGKRDDGVAISPRALASCQRIAEAHARLNLRDEATIEDARVATDVKTAVLGDVYLDDDLVPDVGHLDGSYSQDTGIKAIQSIIDEAGRDGIPRGTIVSQAKDRGMSPDTTKHYIDKLAQKGAILNPTGDVWRSA